MPAEQRFHWTEPLAFARARGRSSRRASPFLLFAICSVLLALPLLATAVPDSPREIAVLAAIALGGGFLFAVPGMWLFSRLPRTILVAGDRITVGQAVIPIAHLASAAVGTTRLDDTQHPVLTLRTTKGQSYLLGIGGKIDADALAAFLQQLGLRESQA